MYSPDIQSKIELLPESAKQELFDFTEFLVSKYLKSSKKQLSGSKKKVSGKKASDFRQFRGVASVKMSTDEIMALTRATNEKHLGGFKCVA